MQSFWKMNWRYFYLNHTATANCNNAVLRQLPDRALPTFPWSSELWISPIFSLWQHTVTWRILEGGKELGNFSWTSKAAQDIQPVAENVNRTHVNRTAAAAKCSWRGMLEVPDILAPVGIVRTSTCSRRCLFYHYCTKLFMELNLQFSLSCFSLFMETLLPFWELIWCYRAFWIVHALCGLQLQAKLQAKYVQLETGWPRPWCLWHTVTAPQTFPPAPGPHERPLPVRGQWRSQGHHGSLCTFQCSMGDCGWCGLSWGKTHKQKQQPQWYSATWLHTWKQYFTITAEHVCAWEPRTALSRAVGRTGAMVAAGWCQQPAIRGCDTDARPPLQLRIFLICKLKRSNESTHTSDHAIWDLHRAAAALQWYKELFSISNWCSASSPLQLPKHGEAQLH